MDMQKTISEMAEQLRNDDLRTLEHYQNNLDAYKIVNKLIKNEMTKKKNKKLLDGFRVVLDRLDCECGGCVLVVIKYQKRLKENMYESKARQILATHYANLEKKSF